MKAKGEKAEPVPCFVCGRTGPQPNQAQRVERLQRRVERQVAFNAELAKTIPELAEHVEQANAEMSKLVSELRSGTIQAGLVMGQVKSDCIVAIKALASMALGLTNLSHDERVEATRECVRFLYETLQIEQPKP